jgi:hypothetical protein
VPQALSLDFSELVSLVPLREESTTPDYSRLAQFTFSGLIYNENYNDILYVIQNGSLLRIDESHESFDIYDHYCLEHDEEEGVLTAIVCEFDDMLFRVNRAQALVFATCMIISVPVKIKRKKNTAKAGAGARAQRNVKLS